MSGEPADTDLPVRRPIGPGTRMWEETGLITFSVTTGAAFLLQTMEPGIAAVLDEHSVFRTDAVGRATRSIASVMVWVYGDQEALAEADRLRRWHAGLSSVDAAGVRHSALDAQPWAWVLLTSPYAFIEGAKYFRRRPMTEPETERYYQENVQLMRNFSVAEQEIPPTYADYVTRFDDIVAHRLRATTVSREFLRVIRSVPAPPTLPRVLRPLWRLAAVPFGRLQYLATVGLTPPAARATLGIEWTPRQERTLRRVGWVLARLVPLLPERLRYFPIAYQARRLERDRRRLRAAIDRRPQ